MSHTYSPLRLMILACLPCVGSAVYAETFTVAAPLTEAPPLTQTLTTAAFDQNSIFNYSKNSTPESKELASFVPTLLGIVINGRESDSLDVLFETIDRKGVDDNDLYYLSVDDLSRLTGVSFVTTSANNNDSNQASNSISSYQVSTPIGDTLIAAERVIHYKERDYIALSTLKKLGISANYSQKDLAVNLNMGWRPEKKTALTIANKAEQNRTIDYRSSKAGLLGLSFNSTLNASETNTRRNGNDADDSSTSRQLYADIGAFGYGLGGVWGVKAIGVVVN